MAGGGVKVTNTKIIGGADGATFVPSVNSNGDLSWTNNKGYSNPVTVNIKGPKGADGKNGAKLVSQVLVGQDAKGGNIYRQTFDDGSTFEFTAPKGDAGSGGGGSIELSIASNTNVMLANNGTMYLYLNPTLTQEEIYMKLLPNAVEMSTREGGVLLYGKNTGASKKYSWSAITALFPNKLRTSPDGTTDCLYFDNNDMLVYDASSDTLKIVLANEFNSLTQIALFGHYYGEITGKLVEANARNLQYMVNDFFMQDETATVLTFEFGEEGGSVTLDLANTQYSSVYFDQYARIPTAGSTTVKCPFSSGRHYVTLINNTALEGVNNSSFITVGKENLIAVKISTLVNDIGADAFSGCTALKKADIPFSATRENGVIEDSAFYNCPLEELKIPEGFAEVGNECFGSVMAKEIELPTSLTTFGSATFISSYIEKIICKATNPVGDDDTFTNALLIVPHDSVETYKSVFGYDKVEAYAYVPKGYRHIETITLTEEVTQVSFSIEPNGTPYNFQKVKLLITFPRGNTGNPYITLLGDVIDGKYEHSDLYIRKDYIPAMVDIRVEDGYGYAEAVSGLSAYYQFYNVSKRFRTNKIREIRINGNAKLPADTVIEVYGMDW
jgi:hypothetical protein